jgi:exportin-7
MNEGQLAEVERLCNIIYAATEPAAMKDAQMQVLQLQSSAEFVPQCQFILDNTKLHYAQVRSSSYISSQEP